MKSITRILLIALFAGTFSLANADTVQVWECQLNDGKTFDDLQAVSSAWLAATKKKSLYEFILRADPPDIDFCLLEDENKGPHDVRRSHLEPSAGISDYLGGEFLERVEKVGGQSYVRGTSPAFRHVTPCVYTSYRYL